MELPPLLPPPPPPEKAPQQQWAMLRRVPQVSRIDMGQADFSLALAAPPDLTRLSISKIVANDPFVDDRPPLVLAADPSGLLLITDSYGRATDPLGADRSIYFVWDAVNVRTHRFHSHQESVNHSGNIGLMVTPNCSGYGDRYRFMVVELLPVSADESITILCYESGSRLWVKKTLPSPMPRYPWSSANVFSHDNKLWWVDLRHGILSFDPLTVDPQVHFVQFPYATAAGMTAAELHPPNTQKLKLRERAVHCTPTTTTPLVRGDSSKRRCVNLSAGNLRFVEMTGTASVPRVTVWTLVDSKACRWKLDYHVKLKKIWDDESYKGTGLPNKRPVLAGIHPADPAVVYFLSKGKLFGVNLGSKRVDDCLPFELGPPQLGIDEESSRFLLTWDLPASLCSSSVRTHGEGSSSQMIEDRSSRDSHFDMMVKSFMNAYTCAYGTLEYDELAKIAIMQLNRRKKKQDNNKFRLSERHLLCYFDEKNGTTSPPKRYAHMNFYVHKESKTKRLRKRVFAEFLKSDTDKDCSWSLLSCKVLSNTSHGGLYGTNADAGQKRKRSSCFACDSEIKHPNSGFKAGHMHAS